jgi:putative peptidoglycan lipid II flippase
MSHSPAASSSHIARSAGVIGLATMTSRVLGLVRDQVLAYMFGAGNAMDAFLIAFRIPNLLRDLFAEGAMSAAFVPTFTRCLTLRGKPDAWRLGNHVINALLVVTAALAVSGIVFAGPLVNLYAGDYRAVPGKLELTVSLTRVMFPFLTLVAVAAALMGMLNSLHRFFIPALSSAMFNVGTILCAFALVPVMSWFGLPPITAIAIGTLVGGLGQVLVQWPVLHREGYRYSPVFDPRDEHMRHIAALMGPGIMGLAAVQINLFVNSWLATSQGTGAVSWLNYAFRLMYLPIGLFGVSIATAALPAVSGHAAREDYAGMRQTVSSSLRMMLMLNVPATAGLVALATPIVALIFEHGRFSQGDTAATAAALAFYAPGLVGYSTVKLISPAFYALRDSRTPVLVSAASVLMNVVLNISLVHTMGYRGLAMGTAIAALFNAGALLWLLRGRLDGVDDRRVLIAFLKIVAASLVMAVAAYEAERMLHVVLPGGRIVTQGVRVFAAIGIGLVVLAVSARALRIREFSEALHVVRARFRPPPAGS